jgi:hypothetical protein
VAILLGARELAPQLGLLQSYDNFLVAVVFIRVDVEPKCGICEEEGILWD